MQQNRRQTLDFFDKFLEPIADAENDLKSGFDAEINAGNHHDFNVDEVSLFLNLCGLDSLVLEK